MSSGNSISVEFPHILNDAISSELVMSESLSLEREEK